MGQSTALRMMMSVQIQKSDWVACTGNEMVGLVIRIARDGTWADVRWRSGGHTWTKRMPSTALQIRTTISIGNGMSVTDETRRLELE